MAPAIVEQRVLYVDTDRMGVAYYANYLKWFEMGRTELLRAKGVPYRELEERGYFLPVAETMCRYLAPARYDEVILIETEVGSLKRVSIRFDYRITRKGDGVALAQGFTHHACTNKDGRITRLPAFLIDAIGRAPSPGKWGEHRG